MSKTERTPQGGYGRALPFVAVVGLLSCGCAAARAAPAPAENVVTVRKPALYPETIEYDRKRDAFVVGSFRDGAVYAIDRAGAVSRIVEDARLCSLLGIAIDPDRDRLWLVSGDLGASLRPSVAGPRHLATVGVYELSSGKPLQYVDLAGLSPGDHLPNGIALDAGGDAYVTDSFSPNIYRVTADGRATIFLQDARFAGDGINLNGLVVHPDGYLLVIKKSDGSLFKVPLADPRQLNRVRVDRSFVGGDGVTLVGRTQLFIVANQVPGTATNAAFSLQSDDGWASAKVSATHPLGPVYPTTGVVRDGKFYVLASKLNELIQAPTAQKPLLQEQATIREVAKVPSGRATAAPKTPQVRRTLVARQNVEGAPGWETQLWSIEYPPGAAAPTHRHPVVGIGLVIEGEYESVFDDESVTRGRAGESFLERPKAEHRMFRNPSKDKPLRFVVTYTIPIGKAPVEF